MCLYYLIKVTLKITLDLLYLGNNFLVILYYNHKILNYIDQIFFILIYRGDNTLYLSSILSTSTIIIIYSLIIRK